MPISKNRRIKRTMKNREFKTVKSARRYVKRFTVQYIKNELLRNKRLKKTMERAKQMIEN